MPWTCEARYRLPVAVYRQTMDAHFPDSAWIRVDRATFDELYRFKTAGGFPTWERALGALVRRRRGQERTVTRLRARRWPSPTPCCTKATCSTRTPRRRARTACAGSSAWSCRRRTPAPGTGEPAEQQTEVLLEADAGAPPRASRCCCGSCRSRRGGSRRRPATGSSRSRRSPSAARRYLSFDEGTERQISVTLEAAPGAEQVVPIAIDGGSEVELLRDRRRARAGRHRARALAAARNAVDPLRRGRRRAGAAQAARAGRERARPSWPASAAARCAPRFVSTHALLAVERGRFVSVLDPPPERGGGDRGAGQPARLPGAGRRRRPADAQRAALVLSSPIILYDFPGRRAAERRPTRSTRPRSTSC